MIQADKLAVTLITFPVSLQSLEFRFSLMSSSEEEEFNSEKQFNKEFLMKLLSKKNIIKDKSKVLFVVMGKETSMETIYKEYFDVNGQLLNEKNLNKLLNNTKSRKNIKWIWKQQNEVGSFAVGLGIDT